MGRPHGRERGGLRRRAIAVTSRGGQVRKGGEADDALRGRRQRGRVVLEGHYCGHEQAWSGRANPALVYVSGRLRPGTALDLGCGEGGNAVWIAQQGWRVTAVDLSATALDRTRPPSA